MRYLMYISVVLMFASCGQEVIVPAPEFEEEHIVVDGVITDSLEYQKLRVGYVNNIGDSAFVPIPFDMTFEMTGGGTTIPFNLVKGTHLVSSIPFKGLADSTYQIEFCEGGDCYQGTFTMPHSIAIDNFSVYETQVSGGYNIEGFYPTITVGSDQYLRYEVFVARQSDTVWQYMQSPVYWTQPTQAGSYTYFLNQDHPLQYNFFNDVAVKIIVYAIQSETADYLTDLKDFMELNFTGSQYQNPPLFFEGGAYGMVYGTSVDSAVFFF